MRETFYKPLTPSFRSEINSSIDKNIAELRTCSSNVFVNMQISAYEQIRKTINRLPDGYPIPMERSERMRLIDADAEISKIESEIEQYKEEIQQWKDNRDDRNLYDVDLKIRELERNIVDCKIEIKCLKRYETVEMEDSDKEIRNKAIEEFAEKCKENILCQTFGLHTRNIEEIAEQMKEVGE